MQKSAQDYLKAYITYQKQRNTRDHNNHQRPLSKTRRRTPSVTEMLKKLAETNYIKYSPYHGSTLTEKGLKEAQKITRKHRLLENFLSNVLHIGNDKVHQEACQMEHTLSDQDKSTYFFK